MPITNVIDGTTSAAWSLLLDWNELDPVDVLETNRNNQVAIYQGNRNPFIDHPEYADQIWGTATAPTSLSLSPSSANIDAGSTQTLSVSASPSGASTSVSWSTSNSGVATVSAGVVTGVAAGSATITATSTMNSNVKATASITVNAVTLNSISIKTPASNTNFKLGETFSSSGLVINANYSNGTIEKSSGFAVTGVDTMVLGAQTATITYEGKTTTYSVDVTNVGANAGSYQSNPDGYNSLYAGSGMWTTTVTNFGMNGSTYGTYSEAYLSSTDASASRSWTISVGNVGNWGSGTITTVAGANIGANTSTQYGNNVIPSAISSMANYTTIVSSKNPLYVGMNFDASNAAKFSMKFITEKAMDAYVVYSTNGGSSYSTIGSKQTTSATDGSTWYEISYASGTSLGSSVRFGVLMISSAGTGIRNRIGDIGVYSYTSGSEGWVDGDFTPLEQATSYANYVMTGIGQNAAGNCAAVKSELDTEYAAMSDLAKDEFAANSASVFINARARIAYLDSWVSSPSPSGIESTKNDSKVLLIISVIIATIGLTAISGFYFINKKKTISN
ncbi:MAG: hypothetical protein EOM77_05045 [Bacteroidia bacterium]|nr:hypothetical protein [Bacteroidia bacterium]